MSTSRKAVTLSELVAAYSLARDRLLAERRPEGYWQGELADSALATATAIIALEMYRQAQSSGEAPPVASESLLQSLVRRGLQWLAADQNPDGGWGDTPLNASNLSATALCRTALMLTGAEQHYGPLLRRADQYIRRAGGLEALERRYGRDRTFAVPILATCAIAGQLDWQSVPRLPFELACLPVSWLKAFRLGVVSYALPALIGFGQLLEERQPSWNPALRLLRRWAAGPTLRKLEGIQPASGGFLEAVPLTSFVAISLMALGHFHCSVLARAMRFLLATVRPGGAWPVDVHLSVWLTTLAINALATLSFCTVSSGPESPAGRNGLATEFNVNWQLLFDPEQFTASRDWLLERQFLQTHPYTSAAPGGWGWSHLPGSVPDADDTAGAILALGRFRPLQPLLRALAAGAEWLLGLQNHDGGWPTFCRGWNRLPFDRSAADLTAHAVRALHAIRSLAAAGQPVPISTRRLSRAIGRGLAYLRRSQQPDGAWLPLWFGNERAADEANRTYGTARVLAAYRDLGLSQSREAAAAVQWLCSAQGKDGGWGAEQGVEPSVEETALAVEALADPSLPPQAAAAVRAGLHWLLAALAEQTWTRASPIGLYFAKLWYFEKLYPIVFTAGALARCLLAAQKGLRVDEE